MTPSLQGSSTSHFNNSGYPGDPSEPRPSHRVMIAQDENQSSVASSQKFAERINAAEWLGPLAPIAISPFFGMACLSGIATYGPDWMKHQSQMFGSTNGLNNPALFWSMLFLTILTSLPRFSKVSKPLSLVAEKLEAYSVIVILVTTRIFIGYATSPESVSQSEGEIALRFGGVPAVAIAGFGTVPIDILMAVAAGLNIIVINSVKLFIEFLVWLTPIPLIDAALELFNKSLCAILIAIYCWSPLVASGINLFALILCASVFFWTRRRIVYYFHAILIPALVYIFRLGKEQAKAPRSDLELRTVFLAESTAGYPKLAKMRLSGSQHKGWTLHHAGWIQSSAISIDPCPLEHDEGLIATTITIGTGTAKSIKIYVPRNETLDISTLRDPASAI